MKARPQLPDGCPDHAELRAMPWAEAAEIAAAWAEMAQLEDLVKEWAR